MPTVTGKGTHQELPEEEVFEFLLRVCLWGETHTRGLKCAASCTEVLQSRVVHCCVFRGVCPGQAPPGLLFSVTPRLFSNPPAPREND